MQFEKSANPLLDNILVTHHSTVSEDDNDIASIRNVSRLISVINRKTLDIIFMDIHMELCGRE